MVRAGRWLALPGDRSRQAELLARHLRDTACPRVGSLRRVEATTSGCYAQDNKATEYTNSFVANNAVVRAGHTLLVEKYYLDHLYTGIIAGAIKGPLARAAYWFNQNVLDGIIDDVGKGSSVARPVRLPLHRPGHHRRCRQRLGRRRLGVRPGPAPGRVRSYSPVRNLDVRRFSATRCRVHRGHLMIATVRRSNRQ